MNRLSIIIPCYNESLTIGKDTGFAGLIYKLSYSPNYLTADEVNKLSKISTSTNNKYFSKLE